MKRALGKGLSQLLDETPASVDEVTLKKAAKAREPEAEPGPSELPIEAIRPNSRQPRVRFDEETLAELAASIREVGIVQPVIVRPVGDGKYELIAGERRLRAAKIAGLTSVPVVIRAEGALASLELALVENVQREDIGPIECANAYRRLAEEFGLTQDQIAKRVGKSRVAISNTLRLLKLPAAALEALGEGRITEGHARALLMVDRPEHQQRLLAAILDRGLSVRQAEEAARALLAPRPEVDPRPPRDPNEEALEEGLESYFGAPVRLKRGPHGGKMVIDFYSDEDLQRILDILGVRL